MNDMTHANYTHGFSGGLTVRGMPVLNTYGGNVYWVDSAGAANGAGTFQRPFSTVDLAVGNCTANNGDYIMVKPGHAETVSAAAGLDLDVAGITIIFLGNDNDKGTITFDTDVLADMDVDAADITMIGPRFVMGLDNVTAPIDVNAARFKLVNVILEDAPAMAPPDWIVADASADDFTIDGLLYRESTTGTQNQSLIQVAAATRPTIRNVRATGDFATGIIENGTAWIDATLENLVLDNSNASPTVCVFLSATSTGWFRNSALRVASGAIGYTASNTMQIAPDVVVTGTDGNVAADPTIGNLEDSAATGAVTTTDTLMSYIKQLVTMMGPTQLDTDTLGSLLAGTAGIATIPAAAVPANNVNMFELLREIWAVLNGTAANENGVQTWPTAAAYANNVSIAEVLAYVQDGVRRGSGTAMAANKSVADAIGFDGNAVVAASAGMLRTMAGTTFVVKKTLTSSAVVTTGVDVTAVSTTGDVIIESVHCMTDATGLAAGTNFTLETDNTKGKAVFFTEGIAQLGANATIASSHTNAGLADAGSFAPILETGKKIIAKCTGVNCTGGGTIDVYLVCRRLADNAALTAAA